MNFRTSYVLLSLLTVTLFGGGIYHYLTASRQHALPEPQKTTVPHATPPQQSPAAAKTVVEQFGSGIETDDALNTKYPNASETVKQTLQLIKEIETFQAYFETPEGKRFLEIWTSPAFAAFEKTDPNTKQWDTFWATHGFERDPDRWTKRFREAFPTGEPEDFEPEMRATFAALFEDTPPEQYPQRALEVMETFMGDPRTHAWLAGYFQGESMGAWGEAILEDLAATTTRQPTQQLTSDKATQTEHSGVRPHKATQEKTRGGPPGGSPSPTNAPSESVTPEGHTENEIRERMNLGDLETLERPQLPTEERIASQLREDLARPGFSPQRMNTALQTLKRYGPTEGIRRLKETDPEIATHLQHHIQKREENE